jgi:Zn-finger nucleic acid-binding protein
MEHCPYCHQNLQQAKVIDRNDQEHLIYECFGCGGHWLPRWLANDITKATAVDVDAIAPKITFSAPTEPHCPFCQTRLSTIKHDSIANGITVLACPQGHGNFFPKGELLKFKTAQEAKISYTQIWGIPTKSIFSVLLPVVAVLAIAGGVPVVMERLQGSTESRTKAASTFTEPLVQRLSESEVFIIFTTANEATSQLTLYKDNQAQDVLTIQNQPSRAHRIRIASLDLDASYTYQLTLKYTNGTTETSPVYYLNTQLQDSTDESN